MKKLICLLLAVCTVFLMVACAGGEQQPTTEATEATPSPYAGIVADTKTWYEEFTSIPVANSSMTTDELREICVDRFRANLSFTWTPNVAISYSYDKSAGKTIDINLPTGVAYSGLCYCSNFNGVNWANGNVYKLLSFYDKETGVLDVSAMGENYLHFISSACSQGAMQAWNSVSNSHNLGNMDTYTPFDSNIVLVGPYTYEPYVYDYQFSGEEPTLKIIQHNGMEVMFESYAAMLPADGLYSSSVFHVMMCSGKPEVVRDANGKIDPGRSYLTVCEQDAYGSRGEAKSIQQSNGIELRPLGTVDKKYTFMELLESGYIPFTIKEFIGEDPVETGEAWLGSKESKTENGKEMTVTEIFQGSVHSNYNICNVIVKVKDSSGNELVSYDPAYLTTPRTAAYSCALSGGIKEEKLNQYADGKNTIHICVQLATGELIDAFNTVLKMG